MSQPTNNKESISLQIPSRPQEPDPYECCGRGCDPCIYDYYAKALARWEQRVAELEKIDDKIKDK